MKTKLVGILLLVPVIACGGKLATGEPSRGAGTTTVFNASFEQAWSAALASLDEARIEAKVKHKACGVIRAERLLPWGLVGVFGERVTIYIDSTSDDAQVKVEVITTKPVIGQLYATDWTPEILSGIEKRLKTTDSTASK